MIEKEQPKADYKFNNPTDTAEILYSLISKISEISEKDKPSGGKPRKKKINWWYEVEKKDHLLNTLLLFSKFIPYTNITKEEKENKDKYLDLVIREFEKTKPHIVFKMFERNNASLEKVKSLGYELKKFTFTLSWRMVIGLGASHPLETSMALHHIYGIPYIPGSAVKGVTKHCCVQVFAEKYGDALKEVADALEKGDDLGIQVENITFRDLIEIFGTQNKAGQAIFFDAYPAKDVKLKIDVINPHYPDYYSGKEPPADWQNPIPIKFLTVEKTIFQFALASKNKELCNKASFWLKKALTNYGIGAKTMLGYGIFE